MKEGMCSLLETFSMRAKMIDAYANGSKNHSHLVPWKTLIPMVLASFLESNFRPLLRSYHSFSTRGCNKK